MPRDPAGLTLESEQLVLQAHQELSLQRPTLVQVEEGALSVHVHLPGSADWELRRFLWIARPGETLVCNAPLPTRAKLAFVADRDTRITFLPVESLSVDLAAEWLNRLAEGIQVR